MLCSLQLPQPRTQRFCYQSPPTLGVVRRYVVSVPFESFYEILILKAVAFLAQITAIVCLTTTQFFLRQNIPGKKNVYAKRNQKKSKKDNALGLFPATPHQGLCNCRIPPFFFGLCVVLEREGAKRATQLQTQTHRFKRSHHDLVTTHD